MASNTFAASLQGRGILGNLYTDANESPAGTTGTAELDAETKEYLAEFVAEYADALYDADAGTILETVHHKLQPPAGGQYASGRIAVTLSMENTVLAELAADHLPDADFLFLDTGYHFPETLEVAAEVEDRYAQELIRAKPLLEVATQDAAYGPNLYQSNPTACCRMRKVEPLAAALSPYIGWVTGLRRVDSPIRAHTPALELDATGRLKISPLVTWSLEETEEYISNRELIIHPLTKQGYPSIGCATCTAKVAPGADPRSGRWQGFAKTECGLHNTGAYAD